MKVFINISINKFLFRFSFLILLCIWIFGLISPCLGLETLNSLYPFSKIMYSKVCHQAIIKSFVCNDIPLLVCARCTGIYFGSAFTSVVFLFFYKPIILKTKYLLIFSTPILLDVIFISLKVYPYNKIISSGTGFLFGSVVFIYILSGIENLIFTKKNNL